jgi:hypothetical protein
MAREKRAASILEISAAGSRAGVTFSEGYVSSRPTVHMRVWLGKLPSSAQGPAINGKRIVATPGRATIVNRCMVNGIISGLDCRPNWLIWREGRASMREESSCKILKTKNKYQG